MYECCMNTNSSDGQTPLSTAAGPIEFTVSDLHRGMRLDAVLAMAPPETGLPGLGIRARRRLWESYYIQVNGRRQLPGVTVIGGDTIRIVPRNTQPEGDAAHAAAGIRLVAATKDFAALHKPAGLHSACIAGNAAPSLEGLLPAAWQELWERWRAESEQSSGSTAPGVTASHSTFPQGEMPGVPQLVTRLDGATSGLVLGVFTPAVETLFRIWEKQGKASKTYFALVHGELSAPLRLVEKLNTDNRKVTQVLDEPDSDSTRHTRVEPIVSFSHPAGAAQATPCTLVRVTIWRGARHQIRAHLAHAGFPLVGEHLYTGSTQEAPRPQSRLYLHHAAIQLPEFYAEDMPGWGFGEVL